MTESRIRKETGEPLTKTKLDTTITDNTNKTSLDVGWQSIGSSADDRNTYYRVFCHVVCTGEDKSLTFSILAIYDISTVNNDIATIGQMYIQKT